MSGVSEVEIIVTGKNLARAAFASAGADVDAVKKRAADLALTLRRAELSASSAGVAAQRAFATAAAAADKAAASATAAADAQDKLARGEIKAEEAAKADAVAQQEAAKATDASARAALAAERASVAQATAAKRAGEESAASADLAAAGSGRMAAGMEKLRGVGKAALEGLVVGSIAVGVESIKASTKFDAAMTLINTQAGVSKDKIAGLSKGVLELAGKVGQDPDSLAEALFHVESNFASMGISSQKALDITRVAAEGARVGQANLVDVTNALTAAVASGIPGVQNMDSAMGALNATVGAGDMKMQDLADAFGTGMVAVVKGFGLSITDVGAALATFGDNNIRGAKAGTELRMAVQAMAKPVATAKDALKTLGMTSDTLAQDMQKGGLKLALQDLVDRMHKAGISAKEQGQIITDMFGKKAGTGIDILVGQFDRLKSKYPDIEKGAKNFGSAWDETQKTFSQRWAEMENSVKALLIQIGQKLTPIVSNAIGWLNKHTGALKILAGVIGGALLVAIGAYTVSMASAAVATIAATWPILAVVAAIGLLVGGLIYAYDHSKTFRDFTKKVWADIKIAWDEAKKHWELIVAGILGPLGILFLYFRQHTDQLKKIWKATWAELQKDWKSFENGPLKDVQKALKDVEKWWKQNGAEIVKDVKLYWGIVSTEIGIALAMIGGTVKFVLTMIKNEWRLVWGLVRDITKGVMTAIGDTITTALHAIHNTFAVISDLIHGRWSKLWSDLQRLVVQGMADVIRSVTDAAANFGSLLWNAGKNLIQGLIDGMNSMVGAVASTISNIASTIRSFLPFSPAKQGPLSGEGSPDKAGAKISAMLAKGMKAGSHHVSEAVSVISGIVSGGFADSPLSGMRGMRSTWVRPVDTSVYAPKPARHPGGHTVHHVHHHEHKMEWVGGNSEDEFVRWVKKTIRVRSGTSSNSVQKAFGPG